MGSGCVNRDLSPVLRDDWEGPHVHLWLIYTALQQKATQQGKAIIPQNKFKNKYLNKTKMKKDISEYRYIKTHEHRGTTKIKRK